MTPTQRTLALFRSLGFTAQVVERWNPHARCRVDLFGVIDILCVMPGVGVVGVQACAGSSHATRRTKAIAEPRLKAWLDSGGRFEITSWRKGGARGERKTWQPRREEIRSSDL